MSKIAFKLANLALKGKIFFKASKSIVLDKNHFKGAFIE